MAAESEPEGTIKINSPCINLEKLAHRTDYLPTLKTYTNPLQHNPFFLPSGGFYVTPTDIVLRHIVYDISSSSSSPSPHLAYLRAGPRKQIFFDPTDSTRAAIVNCGGLCPGLNTVIRELVVGLWDLYGLRHIYGIQAGFRGFYSTDMAPLQLNPKMVHGWHKTGGTLLQTSRGGFHLQNIVDPIQCYGFNQLNSGILVFLTVKLGQ
ncbi:hypothetical protein Q3G72_010216 [Acer saccharum]|nr:hypothetical protein Q3G72_010216 [Acer saccharum]